MKAVVIHATGGPEQLTVADMPDPVPGPGEVLLDVAYAGCNWADTQVRIGIYPHPMTYPMVLGFEVSGTVAALGPGVTRRRGRRSRCGVSRQGRRLCREVRRFRRGPDQAAGQGRRSMSARRSRSRR